MACVPFGHQRSHAHGPMTAQHGAIAMGRDQLGPELTKTCF